MPPVEVYEVVEGRTVPLTGVEPSSAGTQSDAVAAGGTGSPDAPAQPPAGTEQPPGSSPGTTAPAEGESAGDTDDDEPLRDDSEVNAERLNRRFARLTAARRKAERERDAQAQQHQVELAQTRGQLEVMQRMLSGAAPPLPEAPAQPTGPPTSEQYTTWEEYDSARARYEAQQLLNERDQQTQEQRQQAALQARLAALPGLEAPIKAQHPDFDAVVQPVVQWPGLAPHLKTLLFWHDSGPALAYALGKDPALLQRVNQLPPALAYLELGRLSPPPAAAPPAQGLSPTATNGSAPSSPAQPLPAPLTPLSGSGAGAPTGAYNDNMTQQEYRAWRRRTSSLPEWKER